jgi:ketosteroid isomerase-like protein
MKRHNIEFLIRFLDALRRGDREALGSMLKPEVVWYGLRDDLFCPSAREVIETLIENRDDYYRDIERIELIGGTGHAILHASGGDVTEVAGIGLPDGIYNVFALDDDTVTEIRDFSDRAEAYAAAGLEAK